MHTDRILFFILGSGRMGSTFLYRVLKEHPQVALTNEARVAEALHHAYHMVSTPHGVRHELGFQGVINQNATDEFVPIYLKHALAAFIEFYEARFGPDFTHFGEKLPIPAAAKGLDELWPNCRHIVLLRDPRDVVCSYLAMQRIPDPKILGTRWKEFMGQTLEDFAREWAFTYEEILQMLPDHLLVRYVDLMVKPKQEVQRVLKHLNLPEHTTLDQAIQDHRSPVGHGTSQDFAASLSRWKRDMTSEQAARVMEICGATFQRLQRD